MMTYNALLYQHFHIFVVLIFYMKVIFATLYVVKSKDPGKSIQFPHQRYYYELCWL